MVLASAKSKWLCGSTAVVGVLRGVHLSIGWVGDAEAVLCRGGQPVPLVEVHKASDAAEAARIAAAGGWVTGADAKSRVNGILNVARAFGDIEYKHLKESAWAIDNVLDPVTAEPTVKSVELGEGDEFVVFGSDGLFDGLSYAEIIEAVKAHKAKHGRLFGAAKALCDECVSRNVQDNVTAVVWELGWTPDPSFF